MNLVAEFSNDLINLKSGTTYSELRKLEKFKYVASSLTEGGRKRREYVINEEGEKYITIMIKKINIRIEKLLLPLIKMNDI